MGCPLNSSSLDFQTMTNCKGIIMRHVFKFFSSRFLASTSTSSQYLAM